LSRYQLLCSGEKVRVTVVNIKKEIQWKEYTFSDYLKRGRNVRLFPKISLSLFW
jgi:hypothetical protein